MEVEKIDENLTTLERIHRAARAEFLQKGYKDASLRNIVKSVGMTTGAFYGYYKSKEELFDALVGEHYAYLLDCFQKAQNEFADLPHEQQPEVSWEQAKIGDKLYAVPKGNASFSNYDFIVARKDLIDKYGLTEPEDWETFKEFLTELAKVQGETGVIALNTNANRNQTLEPYLQAKGYDYFTEGFDYFYNAENKEELPAWDSVIYHKDSVFHGR